jgi:quinol monooxygenase YgiN
MVRIIARLSSKPGAVAQLAQVLTDLVAPTREEPGCAGYELFQDDEQPSEFLLVEAWADSPSAEAHLASRHVAEAFARAADLLATPPLIHRVTRLA